MALSYNSTGAPTALSGGVAAVTGQGPTYQVAFTGTWAVGNGFQFNLVLAAQTFTLGQGVVTGTVPTAALTVTNRVHFVAGEDWYGSDNGDPTAWEQQAPGAFQLEVTNQTFQAENLLSLSSFQGRMMIASRHTITLWSLDANPANISILQILPNIGTVTPNSTQSLGDFDVLFPSDSGIRSLRVMAINLNGYISDIGSPIDSLIQSGILGQSTSQLGTICAIVEPTSNRYMVYFPSQNVLYVLSYFPASKINAWATYTPVLGNGEIDFSISSFRLFGSVVYFRGVTTNGTMLPNNTTNFIGSYGTPDGDLTYMYDNVQPTVVFPWLDLRKVGNIKKAKGVDAVITGQWSIYGSTDYQGVSNGATLKTLALKLNQGSLSLFSTLQRGLIGWSADGYHFQLKAVGDSAGTTNGAPAKLHEVIFYYEGGEEK